MQLKQLEAVVTHEEQGDWHYEQELLDMNYPILHYLQTPSK